MSLPTVFITPALSVVLLIALLFIARMARGWAATRTATRAIAEDRDRMALEGQRDRALATLQDLAFEHEMGKLSVADYQDLRAFYEGEAVRLLEALS